MRQIININKNWFFSKENVDTSSLLSSLEKIDLPHTWNKNDGQDGGNDYYRGVCTYIKKLSLSDLPKAKKYYLEINGANSSCDIYLNSKLLFHHDGGYSTFRVNITNYLTMDNILHIKVDNRKNNNVYPQVADFTFYGGIYRDVNIIATSSSHFELEYYGGKGVMITPTPDKDKYNVNIKTFINNLKNNQIIKYSIINNNKSIKEVITNSLDVNLTIDNPILWHGIKNPHLYEASLELIEDGNTIDNVSIRFGLRTFEIDPNRGFILNGEEYPLRGVSRHQDRLGFGNALLKEHHDEDMKLIREVGANTIRLAHYQHDQYFYDLCDEYGMVVWAEIPYISHHLKEGFENTISQMKELIIQNYNHPSIVVWGLSNEITMANQEDEDMLNNHKVLNDLCHELDNTRKTTMACVTMCPMDSKINQIPDTLAYNHYFGWYGGNTNMNGPWFDKFHMEYPNIPIACSEYGCEALNWHTSKPKAGDYTEEYQAYYHEELIKQLFTRKYLWATYVWNMFDFGADARNEGGENGQNHKGLVTFDRKYKKDSFYAYKAWLSNDPFVHICGKRYIDRTENPTKVTIYSNQPEVELFVNGVSQGKKESSNHFFYFEVENKGVTSLIAKANNYTDESVIRHVDTENQDYILKETGAILNWYDIKEIDGYYSLNDTIEDIIKTNEGKELIEELMKSKDSIKMSNDFMEMLKGFTVIRFANIAGSMIAKFTKEELLDLNKKLNKIKKI